MRPPNDPGNNSPGPAAKPGRWRALATAMLLVGSLFPALAAHPAGAAVSDVDGANVFQLDGNTVVNVTNPPTMDWEGLFDHTTLAALPDGPAWVSSKFNQDWMEPDHSYFVPGKDGDLMSQWECQDAPGNLTPKDNIMNAYVTAFNGVDGNGTPHQLLYLGLERKPGSTGDAMAGFWFFQGSGVGCSHAAGANGTFTGQKTQGDLLVLANFTNGGGTVDIQVYHWQSSSSSLVLDKDASVNCGSATGPVSICGIANSTSITPPWPDSAAGTNVALTSEDFFEIGLDLSTIYANPVCSNTFMAETRSSQSLSATLKDYTMGSANICRQTSTSTALSKASGNAGDTVYDTATVGGNPGPTSNAAGTVTFQVYAAQNCTSPITAAKWTENAAWDGGQLKASTQSSPWTLPGPGTYYFVATYSGYGANEASSSGCNDEPVTVKVNTTTATHPSSTSITLGQSLTDIAEVTGVTGAGTPGGNVTFYVCGTPATSCTTGGNQVGVAKSLSGTGITASATSDAYTPGQAGTYCFRAEYAGAGSYNGSKDGGSNECFTVNKVAASIKTTPQPNSPTVLDTKTDLAVVTGVIGGPAPTGSVTFIVCGPDNTLTTCTGSDPTVQPLVTINLTADAIVAGTAPTAHATSNVFNTEKTGKFCYSGVYNPGTDTNYTTATDATTGECFTVGAVSSTTATEVSATSVILGQTVTDTATVSGANGIPMGDVHFYVCGPGATSCGVTGSNDLGTVNLIANNGSTGTTGSTNTAEMSYKPASVGTYCFHAVYDPASNGAYSGSSDNGTNECFSVGTLSTTTTTQVSSTTIPIGQSITDTATVSGSGGIPTGDVHFYLCGPSATSCGVTGTDLGTVALETAGGTSGETVSTNTATMTDTPAAAGTYCFHAVYEPAAGSSYSGSADNGANECFTVNKLDSTIKTTPSSVSFPIGGSVTDKAVVAAADAEGATPTGTVTFFVCANATSCTSGGTELFTGSGETKTSAIDLVDGAAISPSYTPPAAGSYCFRGEYSGSTTYNGKADGSSTECFTVYVPYTPPNPSPTITTTPNPKTGVIGTAMADAATLSGGNGNPTGTISFYLYGPGDTTCGTDLLASSPTFKGITVSSKSATSPAYTASKIGVYQWVAQYSGDGANSGVRGNCGDTTEQVVIGAAPSKITTAPNPGPGTPVTVGTAIKDVANVTGSGPTGTVSFHLYGPGDTSCTTDLLSGKTGFVGIALSGGSATSPTYTTDKVGVYQWVATYSGDAGNQPSSGACGDTTEQVTTGAVLAQIVTGANDLALAVLGLPFLAAGLSLLLLVGRRREQNG